MVASIQSAPSADYYIDAKHAEYYLEPQSGLGVWRGEAAEKFGYAGIVTQDTLQRAFQGMRGDGTGMLASVFQGKQRAEAWDVTLSGPKSVSVEWATLNDVTSQRGIERCGMKAAERVVDYLEANALINRCGKQGQIVDKAKGLFAICPHSMSRAGDPQLHFHILVFNLCERTDGKPGAIRSRDLYLHKMAAGALFRTELAYLLQKELGLQVEKDDWSFRVADVPQSLCDEQSTRRRQIEEIASEEGWTSQRVLAEIAAYTRDRKGTATVDQMRPIWIEQAEEHGFTPERARSLLDTNHEKSRDKSDAEKSKELDANIHKAIETLAGKQAYFPARDVVRQVAVEAQGNGISASEVLQAVEQTLSRFKTRFTLHDDIYEHYSTKENVAAEKELISRVEAGRESRRLCSEDAAVKRAEKNVEEKLSKSLGVDVSLTDDQKKALRHVTLEPGDTKLVQGYAGTGKTQMLQAADSAWRATGFKVVGAAIGGKAALGLENATGISSYTVEGLLRKWNPKEFGEKLTVSDKAKLHGQGLWAAARENWQRENSHASRLDSAIVSTIGKAAGMVAESINKPHRMPPTLTDRSIVVVDEAAMLPTKTLLAVKRECDRAGAKLVLIGDKMQLPPIEAGGPFTSLANRVGHQSLTTIVRQREDWMRKAAYAVIEDQPERALELYAKNKALQVCPTRRLAVERLVEDFRKLKQKELPDALILTSTNAEAKGINNKIQQDRKAAGELGIFFVRLPNGEKVHKNDRVLFTLNHYGIGARNGLLGTVVKVEHSRGLMGPGSVTIRLDKEYDRGFLLKRPQLLKVDLKKYKDLQLGYAVTTHKAQGATVNKSFVLFGGAMFNKETAFTQLTRAKYSTSLYTSEMEAGEQLTGLVKGLRRSSQKDLARDHLGEQQQQHLEDLQRNQSTQRPEDHTISR